MIDTLLLSELRSAALGRLLPVLGQVLEKTDDALFDVWQHGHSGQQALFDALRELRRQRSVIEGGVGDRIGEAFDALAQRNPIEEFDDEAESPLDLEFSLLDPEVLEEQLTCDRLAAAVDRRHGEGLARLLRGLAQVLDVRELPAEANPLAPIRIARAWRDALTPVLESIEWRLVAYKHLERGLMTELGGVIEELCRLLQARGITVQLPAQRPRRTVLPASSGRRSAGGGEDASWQGRTGDEGSRARDVDGDRGAAASGEGWSEGRGDNRSEQRNDGPDPVYEAMREMFAEYLGRRKAGESGPPASQGPLAPGEPVVGRLDPKVAVLVLGRLQRQPTPGLLAAVDDRHIELVELLRSELLRTAVSLGRAQVGVQLEPHDEQALTMVGMLFDTLLDQGRFSREVRERLVRLYVPYAKVALLDRRMFAHKLHPARRLLNLFSESCDGNAGDAPAERELLTKVFEVSERLIDTFDEDPAVFAAVEAEFSDFLTRHRRRIALAEQRAAEAQRGKERLEEARLEATLELDSLVGKRQVPKPIGDFLRRDWAHHLTMVALREGVESDAFRDARAPGVKLWMALLACESGVPPPSGLLEELLPALKSSGHPDDAARAALADVIAALRAVMPRPAPAPAAAATTTRSPDPPPTATASTADLSLEAGDAPVEEKDAPVFELVSAAPDSEPSTQAAAVIEGDIRFEVDASHALPELVERARALTVGTWLEFIETDGSRQPAKLSWVSPISSRMLFVNRRGLRMCTISAEELAALMADGKVALREVDAAFDRAMLKVLDQLRGAPEVAGG